MAKADSGGSPARCLLAIHWSMMFCTISRTSWLEFQLRTPRWLKKLR